MTSMPAPVLEARGVEKHYGPVTALGGVTLDVARGECVALVGESGSGKSTLLRCFNRMVEADAGEVRVDGADVRAIDPVLLRRGIGYVPQDGGLLPHWTVLRNATLVPWLRGVPRDEAASAARESLSLVGIAAERFGSRWPHELSGGQRQRVAIARALAARPSVLLMDEPFGALDAITRADLQEAFESLRASLSLTTVLVTHDLHEAERLADRIAVMRAGQIEQVDRPEVLVASPATPYVENLLRRARLIA